MSLQQAALLTQNPLLRGLQAGQSAYNSPLATSIEASLDQAQQQRASLGLNPASSYPVSGTSAAAYQYLHGQGPYPYTQSNQGPTTVSYEQAHGITGPTSQAALAQAAKDAPWRGTSGSPQSTVKTKPSTGSELAGLALPAALAYKYLATPEMKKWVADKTGFDIFGPSAKEAATLGKTTGATTAGEGVSAATPYQMTSADAQAIYGDRGYGATGATPATQTGTYDLGEFAGVDQAAAEQAAKNYMGDAYGVDAAAAWNAAPALNTTAGEIGYVYNPLTGALEGGTAEQIAAASIPTAAEGVSAIEAANAAQAANEYAMAADAAAGAEGAGLMAIDPYTAGLAALLAMTPGGQNILGKLTGAVGSVLGGVGDLAGSAVNTVTNAIGDVASGAGDLVSGAVDFVTGGCFLTTAAVEHMGQPDDGRVLMAFREFRDTYMMQTPERRREVEWYYRKAPKIVEAINKNPKENAIYREMYNHYIIPTYKAIKSGDMEHAHQEYTKLIGFAKKASGLSEKELSMGPSKGIPKNISKNFNAGGEAEDDGETSMVKPQIEPTNKFGQLLDSIVANKHDRAVQAGDTKTANKFKEEIAYRKRMKGYQQQFAMGGLPTPPQNFNLGGYSDGGRLLRGPGDGVSDSIPATIGQNKQPARLADGEFVVPARIVSELGNGSTEAGARKLYAMMDRIQADRKKSVGRGKVAVNSRADKHLPA